MHNFLAFPESFEEEFELGDNNALLQTNFKKEMIRKITNEDKKFQNMDMNLLSLLLKNSAEVPLEHTIVGFFHLIARYHFFINENLMHSEMKESEGVTVGGIQMGVKDELSWAAVANLIEVPLYIFVFIMN